jgi:hypothetical protein
MRKGNMSVHMSNVKGVIKDFAIQLAPTEKDEISEESILKKIRAANY